ncbi:hypothetical protein [Haloprofundus marisrubri]|uniref:hypothetical protein n=1 Tax=Haloprofundus marisrubri TaxID=1514971 RepID=UPI0012BA7FDB|nr:hypothetical protein [Haloprofundus marisrubri]
MTKLRLDTVREQIRLGALTYALILFGYILTGPPTAIAIIASIIAVVSLALTPQQVDEEAIRQFIVPATILTGLISVSILLYSGYDISENTGTLLIVVSLFPFMFGWESGGWIGCALLAASGIVNAAYFTSNRILSLFFVVFAVLTAYFSYALYHHDFDDM